MKTEFLEFFDAPEFFAETIDDDEDCDQLASFSYPGAISDAWVPGVSVRIGGDAEKMWIGHFLQGKESPNGADLCCAHPDGKHIVVVSRGTPYLVNATDPKSWQEIPMRPIIGYCAGNEEGVLILYDFTRVMGLRADGNTWTTRSLSWDGLKSVCIANGKVEGEGWDASTSKYVPFSVDLRTGESLGGASPPH